jgi:hypothetical protein
MSIRTKLIERILASAAGDASLANGKFTQRLAGQIVDDVFTALKSQLKETGHASIPGFGNWKIAYVLAYIFEDHSAFLASFFFCSLLASRVFVCCFPTP